MKIRPELRLHIAPNGRRWSVRRSGASRAWKIFPTMDEAIQAAMTVTPKRKALLYVHGDDGRIRSRVFRPICRKR